MVSERFGVCVLGSVESASKDRHAGPPILLQRKMRMGSEGDGAVGGSAEAEGESLNFPK